MSLTTEDVLAAVREHAGPAAALTFSTRFEPEGPRSDKVLCAVVPCPDGRYLAVTFTFGRPDPDPQLAWKPDWHGVYGPMTREELEAFGRSLNEPAGDPAAG